jgi:hypothetical protein
MGRPSRSTYFRRRAAALAALIAVALVVTHSLATGSAHGRSHHASHVAAPRVVTRRTVPKIDPFRTPAMASYVATRQGTISAAVENLNTGVTYLYHPGVSVQTASIVKVDILETLLHSEQDKGPLDADDAALATGMIENSNNDDATDLWNEDNAPSGIAAYNTLAGLKDTVPNDDGLWGETMTTAADQLVLLRRLVFPNSLLDTASRDYQLGLMEQVESDQRWGVSGGVPSTATIALKNGWVPLTSNTDWEVNSIGHVRGEHRNYLLAVLSAHDASEAYGITTIQGIAKIVWKDLGASG